MRDIRQTTKNRIIEYLRGNGWVSGSELETQAILWHTKASVISRRARELAHEGRIKRTVSARRTVQYASLGTFENTQEANSFIRSLNV